jgi:hypothetical protein
MGVIIREKIPKNRAIKAGNIAVFRNITSAAFL